MNFNYNLFYQNFNDLIYKHKSIVLLVSFFLFFFFQSFIYLTSHNNKCSINNKNEIEEKLKKINNNILLKIFIILTMIISFIYVFYFLITIYSNKDSIFCKKNDYFIYLSVLCIMFFTFFINLFLQKFNIKIGNSIVSKVFSLFFNFVFFVVLFIYFFNDIYYERSLFNLEFIIVLTLIFIYLVFKLKFSIDTQKDMFNTFKTKQYNFLTINCLLGTTQDQSVIEDSFDNQNLDSPALLQYKQIVQQKGGSYIQLDDGLPVKFLNPKTNLYQDLILADFYYPGSYYSYLADSPNNGHPSIESLKLALTDFQNRFIHLDLFNSSNNDAVVRCEKMAKDAKELKLKDCLSLIKKYGWDSNQKYPLFLYLNINGNQNESFYSNLYLLFKNIFGKNLMDKKYSFSGRNGTFPISQCPLKDAKNKIIICTNIYPTRTIFDELINAGNVGNQTNPNLFLNIDLYKETYVDFNSLGISQDQDKTKLLENHRRNLSFYYTLQNIDKIRDGENKSGLYNPNFQDLGQYGIQGTLMYLFVPDNNLNKWYMYFKSKNNLYPVLKDESLRALDPESPDIKQQNPIMGLQQPQKYCIIPGFMDTQKSNITVGDSNNSCT